MKKLSAIAKNIIVNRIIDDLKTVDKKAINDFLSDYIYNDSDFNSCNELYNTVVNDYMLRVIILGF